MIDYDTALQRLLAQARRLPAELSALAQAAERILAADLISPIALPSFDHAAMDGYALSAGEALAAGTEHAVRGSQAAGDAARGSLGGAWEIMTGARLPDGLDAVIAVERAELIEARPDGTPLRIRLREPLAAGRNVRLTGSDVAAGEAVLGAGTRIECAHLMLLAALGVAQVAVVRRPRIAIICTGKELQADLAQALRPGQIYNSNGPYLTAALAALGAHVLSCDTVDDSAVTYGAALRRAIDADADLVISTGAVSMGRYDFVPDTLRQFNAELLFHKVAIRPGRPLLAARLDHGPLVVALPGTPMAVVAGLRFFVTPLLRAMTGQGGEPPLRAILDSPQQPKAGLRHFLRATLHQDAEGQWHAAVPSQQQPYRIQPFAQADAWVVLGEDAGDCAAGTRVEVVGLECGRSLSTGNAHQAQAGWRGSP
ncbi:MAG: molybdopterin molybdotransferase MoeA [Rhodanobacter sp.]|nr:molybdopterin molybdotransferase MoeA [Rhodanobacter sp.]